MTKALMAERRPARWRPLAERVATARRAAGLTQEELAERLEVRQGFVANVERGTHRPRAEQITHWAHALALPVGELLVLAGYVPDSAAVPEPDQRTELDRWWDSLPARRKRMARRMLEAIPEVFLQAHPHEKGAPQRADHHEGE